MTDTPDVEARQQQILGHPIRIEPMMDWTDEMKAFVHYPPGYANAGPSVYGVLMHNVPMLKAYKDIMLYFLEHGSLPLRDRELAILRTAWLRQIPFVWGEHVKHGKLAGLTSEEIERVTQGSAAPGWNERDRTVLKAAEELLADAMICDATWAALAREFEPGLLVELLACVGQYQALGLIQNAIRMPLFEGNPGLTAR
jgi:alkylhydroperoxidase family enzyme